MATSASFSADLPKMICYSAQPNAYFEERAGEVARLYDGFFFTIGSWEEGVAANLGLGPDAPATTDWLARARASLERLRAAGAGENLLGVHFGQDAPWPSAETLLADDYTRRMAAHFAALGRGARDLGFRGVSIDVEYCYQRYSLTHPVYTYDGYSAEDLMAGARRQGRAVMAALLDEFPQAVVFVLPGEIWSRPIGREFMLGMLAVMAERDAPGGYHLGYERAYCLYEEAMVSQAAIPRTADCYLPVLADAASLDYWRRRCSVAPGVWPLHMVETGGHDYPVRPWSEELQDLRRQMETLRWVAKRYIWSYSGNPIWYAPSPEAERHGLKPQTFDGAEEAIAGWHDILADRRRTSDPRLLKLVEAVAAFDRGEIDAETLCARFGTPGDWLILGPLDNPVARTAFSAPRALRGPIRPGDAHHGRDGTVRWFVFHNHEPLGAVRLQAAFDWRNTDYAAAHAVCDISVAREVSGFLNINWDDGVAVWLGDQLAFEQLTYPPEGHGLLYRDRYLFEERAAVTIPAGTSRLAVTCVNQQGSWGFNLRFTDADGYPLEGLTFSLPAGF